MNFEKFTIKSQEALQKSAEIALSHQQQAIEAGHLLVAAGREAVIADDGESRRRGIEQSARLQGLAAGCGRGRGGAAAPRGGRVLHNPVPRVHEDRISRESTGERRDPRAGITRPRSTATTRDSHLIMKAK